MSGNSSVVMARGSKTGQFFDGRPLTRLRFVEQVHRALGKELELRKGYKWEGEYDWGRKFPLTSKNKPLPTHATPSSPWRIRLNGVH